MPKGMMARMFSAVDDSDVFKAVISAVMVDVMKRLVLWHRPVGSFPDEAVKANAVSLKVETAQVIASAHEFLGGRGERDRVVHVDSISPYRSASKRDIVPSARNTG